MLLFSALYFLAHSFCLTRDERSLFSLLRPWWEKYVPGIVYSLGKENMCFYAQFCSALVVTKEHEKANIWQTGMVLWYFNVLHSRKIFPRVYTSCFKGFDTFWVGMGFFRREGFLSFFFFIVSPMLTLMEQIGNRQKAKLLSLLLSIPHSHSQYFSIICHSLCLSTYLTISTSLSCLFL